MREWWAGLAPEVQEKLRANPEDAGRLTDGLIDVWPLTALGHIRRPPDPDRLRQDVVGFVRRQ
ncbi:hypothetical protein BH23ACT6_BH23ACT6_25010 [soil metagenome]